VATKAAASACKEHFAAAEEPELLAEGIPTSFRGLRKWRVSLRYLCSEKEVILKPCQLTRAG
jgi:hypothetical protein